MFTYLKLKFYRRFQKRFILHKTKILGRTVFYNDPRSLFSEYKLIFKDKIYRPESSSRNPLIIDGGSHIGLSILYFKHIYPESKIIGFEPDQQTLSLLRKNINGLSDVQIIESGLYSQDKEISFDSNETDGGKISSQGQNKIKVERLSKYINSEVDFLKLNIEGAELDVLKDLDSSGKLRLVNEICLEWHSFAGQKQNLGELLMILEKNGFKYLINHFDYRVNPRLRPPFKLSDKTQYYLLVYARKI